MKTMFIVVILLILNTTLLVSEPLAALVNEVNTWVLIVLEIILFSMYFVLKFMANFQKACQIELKNLNIFVYNSKDSRSR